MAPKIYQTIRDAKTGTAKKKNGKTLAHSKAALFPRRRRTRYGQEIKETAQVHDYGSKLYLKGNSGLDKTMHLA